jgi:hypothetical protein
MATACCPKSDQLFLHTRKCFVWSIDDQACRVFGAQIASQGQLLLLGAKVNSLIDKGQWWRFVTPSLLHANIMHLLVFTLYVSDHFCSISSVPSEGSKAFGILWLIAFWFFTGLHVVGIL